MVTGDNGTTALTISNQCQLVKPTMRLHRVKDDEDQIKTELIKLNEKVKECYIQLRNEKEGKTTKV